MSVHVWSSLRAPLDGRTRGRTGGRTDINDIVLSRRDRKRIFAKNNFRESKKSEGRQEPVM